MKSTPRKVTEARNAPLWISAALVFASFVLYWQTLGFGFLNWDDPEYILRNPQLAGGLTPSSAWWALTTTYQFYWHPLTWISYLLDFTFFGFEASGYHAVNFVLHAASSVAVFLAMRALTGSRWRSAMVAALFCVHPLRVESVAWVSERKDPLSGLFWFLTLWAYARYIRNRTPLGYAAVHGSFVLALMSKPMVVTLPVALLLLDQWPLARKETLRQLVIEKLPMLAMATIVGVITLSAQSGVGATAGLADVGLPLRVANALVAYVLYAWKSVWPEGLAALYPFLPIPAWQGWGAVLLLGGLTHLSWKLRKEHPYLSTGWLWFLLTLLPVIGLTQVGTQSMADRFTYIPQVGLWIALVWGCAEWAEEWKVSPTALAGASAAVLLVLGWVTFVQVSYWRDPLTLWERTLAVAPVNYVAHHNYATALRAANRRDEAMDHLRAALRVNPGFAEAQSNLGGMLAEAGRPQEALSPLEALVKDNPRLPDAHNNLGMVYGMLGRNDDALRQFQMSLILDQSQVNTHSNLAVIYEEKGMFPQAVEQFQAVLAIEPSHAEARRSLERLRRMESLKSRKGGDSSSFDRH